MSTFEIICIAAMTTGVVLIIGAVGYCFISKVIEKCKSRRQIEDAIDRYWQNRYGTPTGKRKTTPHKKLT